MDARPPPPVTIKGGPGWSPDGPHERLGEADEPPQGRSPSRLGRHRIGGLALATAAGFALATGLAELRMATIEESAEGVLSLAIRVEANSNDVGGGDVAAAADGQLSLATSVTIHNTGPRPVALERAELLGTTYRSDELGGRWLADGKDGVIVLMRSIDCSRPDDTQTPGPLRVHATTAAGTRTVDLRMNTANVQAHDEQARGYCSRNDPGAPPRVRALTGPGDPGDLPQGVYRFVLTREQLLADGLSVQEADGNAGIFTYTLRAGRWRYEQQPAVPGNAISMMTTCEGSYTARGDTASFTTTTRYDGGDCSPPTWAARWTADAENLVWNDITEPDFGFVFGSMPWQRIED